MKKTTWRNELADFGDKITDCTLTDEELDARFYPGFGVSEGKSFVAWSKEYVYFTVVYDGAEWVGRVPRNPTSNFTPEHFGGG